MFVINSYIYIYSLLSFNFYFLFLSIIFSAIILYFSKILSSQYFFKNLSSFSYLKGILIFSLLISFFIHVCISYLYIIFSNSFFKIIVSSDYLLLPNLEEFIKNNSSNFYLFNINLYLTLDFFGLILLTLAYLVGFISILALDTRLY